MAKPQAWSNHSPSSSSSLLVSTVSPIRPTTNGTCGALRNASAAAAVRRADCNRFPPTRPKPSDQHRAQPQTEQRGDRPLGAVERAHAPPACWGAPSWQRQESPRARRNRAFCHSWPRDLRFRHYRLDSAAPASSLRKIRCMARPISAANSTAPTARGDAWAWPQHAGRQDDSQHIDGRAGVRERR